MQKEIKRIHVLQAGLFLGAFYALIGLLAGLIYAGFALLIGMAGLSAGGATGSAPGGGPGAGGAELLAIFGGMGVLAVILIPVLYGFLGFLGGIIGAAIYNLVAKVAGGLKFDVADIGPVPQ